MIVNDLRGRWREGQLLNFRREDLGSDFYLFHTVRTGKEVTSMKEAKIYFFIFIFSIFDFCPKFYLPTVEFILSSPELAT